MCRVSLEGRGGGLSAGVCRTRGQGQDEGGRAGRIAAAVDSKNEEWPARNTAADSP